MNAADTQGTTALMYAASGGNTQVVRLLLKAGADVNFGGKRKDLSEQHISVRKNRKE